jgi:hypothetical protein
MVFAPEKPKKQELVVKYIPPHLQPYLEDLGGINHNLPIEKQVRINRFLWIDANVNSKENTIFQRMLKEECPQIRQFEVCTSINEGWNILSKKKIKTWYIMVAGSLANEFVISEAEFWKRCANLGIMPCLIVFCFDLKKYEGIHNGWYRPYSNQDFH